MMRCLAIRQFLILLSGSLVAAAPPKPVAPQPRSAEEIEKLYDQAAEFFDQGKYPQAKYKIKQAYGSFGLLREKDADSRTTYLRLLCDLSVELHELKNTLAYAKELATHAVDPSDRAFA
ncbi:MAG: hypothetical protein VB980_01085, partial [Opitutales bacterium]